MSGATGFRRPRQVTKTPRAMGMSSNKPTSEESIAKILSCDANLEEPHSPQPSLNQTQEIMDEDSMSDSDDSEIDDNELNDLLQAETQQWLSEFGEKLFKLTVQQWLVKRDRQHRKALLSPKDAKSVGSQPPKKRQRS